MSDTDHLARLERLEHFLGLDAPQIEPFALPPAVASGELITSAWGNSVVSTLTTHDTKLANLLFRIRGGAGPFTTDANGIFTIPHGLPATPEFVLLTPTGNTAAEQAAKLVVFSRTATYFEVRAYRSDTIAPMPNSGMGVSWLAGGFLV